MDGIGVMFMGIALFMAVVWMIADARQYGQAKLKRNRDHGRDRDQITPR